MSEAEDNHVERGLVAEEFSCVVLSGFFTTALLIPNDRGGHEWIEYGCLGRVYLWRHIVELRANEVITMYSTLS